MTGNNTIQFDRNRSTTSDVLIHLQEVSANFSPPLDERIDLPAYAAKMNDKAERFEAWENGKLEGLIAVYANDPLLEKAFITNVSVAGKFMGKGIANQLLDNCEAFIREKGFREIQLEVGKEAMPAIRFYTKHGYTESGQNDTSKFMHKKLTK
jgi:ribosomal protein S18 acetylase RimI-like enzyme